MKQLTIVLILLLSIITFSCNTSSNVSIETSSDSVSYALGVTQATQLKTGFAQDGIDTILSIDLVFKGFDAGAEGVEPAEGDKEMLDSFFNSLRPNPMGEKPEAVNPAQADSLSYAFGVIYATQMRDGFAQQGLDTLLSTDLVFAGFADGGKDASKIEGDLEPILQSFFMKLQEAQMAEQKAQMAIQQAKAIEAAKAEFGHNLKAGEEFLAKNKERDGVITTASGLQYEVLKEGTGEKPLLTEQVKCHYHGTILDGTVFDSSVERGEPIVFPLQGVIPGWTEVLQLMPAGSKWKVFIPQDIAYGASPRPGGPIEPLMTLVFEIELLEVVK